MPKAKDAFRTISEVSEALDTPAHVLRFWESKFTQIKPVKRAGGRRYYRPDDLALLSGIKTLLHDQGMTIKGAQKLLREKGAKHVVGLGQITTDDNDDTVEHAAKVEIIRPEAFEKAIDSVDSDESETMIEALAPDAAADAPSQSKPPVAPPQLFTVPSAQSPVKDNPPIPLEDTPPTQIEQVDDNMNTAVTSSTDDDEPDAKSQVRAEPITAALAVTRLPDALPDAKARFFDALQHANPDVLQARSAQIAPLITKLTEIRNQMRHS